MTTSPKPAVLMVAPNGARRGKTDHPALPITIPETVATAVASAEAGASVLHAHIRDAQGQHSLDAGLYAELLNEMAHALPGFPVQITTESAGIFGPEVQADLLTNLRPELASVGLREICQDLDLAKKTYHSCRDQGTFIQHILYDAEDLARFKQLRETGTIPAGPAALLLVLGRYATNGLATPADLDPFLEEGLPAQDEWWLCAFGPAENACLTRALALGGHARMGFENNLLRQDGSRAASNTDLTRETRSAAQKLNRRPATWDEARQLLSL